MNKEFNYKWLELPLELLTLQLKVRRTSIYDVTKKYFEKGLPLPQIPAFYWHEPRIKFHMEGDK